MTVEKNASVIADSNGQAVLSVVVGRAECGIAIPATLRPAKPTQDLFETLAH